MTLTPPAPVSGVDRFAVRALLLGQRIDVRALADIERLASQPLTVRTGAHGVAVIFRYGAVVLFNVQSLEEVAFVKLLEPFVQEPLGRAGESEEATIEVDLQRAEQVDPSGAIVLHEPSVERLQIVSDVLAKSVVLAYHEEGIAEVFDRVEPLAARIQTKGHAGSQGKALLREIGAVLLKQHKMVGRVEMFDRPEILWERPDLERLYDRLLDEYELGERHRIVERKLNLISRTAETALGLLHDRRSLRVEWYIVILILIEIVIYLYELFLA